MTELALTSIPFLCEYSVLNLYGLNVRSNGTGAHSFLKQEGKLDEFSFLSILIAENKTL